MSVWEAQKAFPEMVSWRRDNGEAGKLTIKDRFL